MTQETIRPDQLKATNSPTNGYTVVFDSATESLTWTPSSGVVSIGALVITSGTGDSVASENTQDIVYRVETYDTDNMHNNSSYPERITINTPGKYIIYTWVNFEPDANGTRLVMLKLNGVTPLSAETKAVTAAAMSASLNVTAIMDLVQNDYITVNVFQDSGFTLIAASRFAAQRIA